MQIQPEPPKWCSHDRSLRKHCLLVGNKRGPRSPPLTPACAGGSKSRGREAIVLSREAPPPPCRCTLTAHSGLHWAADQPGTGLPSSCQREMRWQDWLSAAGRGWAHVSLPGRALCPSQPLSLGGPAGGSGLHSLPAGGCRSKPEGPRDPESPCERRPLTDQEGLRKGERSLLCVGPLAFLLCWLVTQASSPISGISAFWRPPS